MAEHVVPIREASLLSKDFVGYKAFLTAWMNSRLAPPPAPPAISEIAGRRSELGDGTAVASLMKALTGKTIEGIIAGAQGERDQLANWAVVLGAMSALGVQPLHPGHSWTAEALRSGDVLAVVMMLGALAARFGVVLPRDIFVWDGPAGTEQPAGFAVSPSPRLAGARPAPCLFAQVYLNGVYTGQTILLRNASYIVGRLDSEDGDVLLDEPSVSAEHCRIWFDGSNFCVEDEGSTHGTLVLHPWAPTVLYDLGSRDTPKDSRHVLWRGSELRLGDAHLVIVHIESTAYYSDYVPPPPAAQSGLNLDIIAGPPFEGMTTIGVHLPGSSYGALSEDEAAVAPACGLAALELAHATMPGLEPLHGSIVWSAFLGRFVFCNHAVAPCRVRHARMPERGAIAVLRGGFEIVDTGDEIDLSGVVVFRATVIPPGAAAAAQQ